MANLSTQNIGTNYKGILNLGSTINTNISTTLQAITDGDGNNSPLNLATNAVTITPPTLTGSSATSALSITQTHNTTGSPDVIKIDIVNTASGANTRYLNFCSSGVSNFSIDRLGNIYYLNNGSITHSSGTFIMNHGGVQYFRSNSAGINIGTGGLVPSAKLSVESTTQGFLPPRMTATQASAIASPAEGLMLYVTNTNGTFTAKGWWGYNGSSWEKLNN